MTAKENKITGMKLALETSAEPTEEDLLFIRQMGVNYVSCWLNGKVASGQYYSSRRRLFEKVGLKLYSLGNLGVHNQDAIVLGLENRDEKIAEYIEHIRNLGRAGIPYTTYAHMADGVWRTQAASVRGGAISSQFDWEKAKQGRRYPGRTPDPDRGRG